ncbi:MULTISPECIES: MotA/TolQ/ExbB proton channel family protein [Holospora]|uniref:Biopolymer transport protein ExbB n=2 Tax=Holospora TaxID=44747 RepID=A0A061JGR1_9PROT|nr:MULTISPECIES: MotA/TolQ/ExbB proton channel family protein [Holospora]ETZ04452.1 biopolymer transport protein ExbB [Holospora undulata HU1]GAJ46714.1 biopolymer transport protein ExbB [Holospora elegans E1]
MEEVVVQVSHGISLWGLFWQADWIIKGVMLGLLGASVVSWSIIVGKSLQLRKLYQEASDTQESFEKESSNYWEHVRPCSWSMPFAYVVSLFVKESRRGTSSVWRQKVENILEAYLENQRDYLMKSMGTLDTIGSISPFVGLFGTVWGIINSFKGIASSGSTSIAAVAPGMAEALFATAIGLVAAIPAAVAYNRLSLGIQSYMTKLEGFCRIVHVAHLDH